MKVFTNIGLGDYLEIFQFISLKYINSYGIGIITLTGEMGAGKTTFTRNYINFLGTKDIVNSPTFSLLNEYKLSNGQEIFHFDLYRLLNESEIDELGFESIWGKQGLSIIEWWEKADRFIPFPRLHVSIDIESLNTRRIVVKSKELNL